MQLAKILSAPLKVSEWQTGGVDAFTYKCWSGKLSKLYAEKDSHLHPKVTEVRLLKF